MPTESTLTVAPEAAAHQPPPLPESPLAFLHALAQSAPSYSCLSLLAGEILIATLKESPDLSAPYLFAAARHLPAEHRATRADGHASRDDDNSQSILSILLDVRIYIYLYLSMYIVYAAHLFISFILAILICPGHWFCNKSMSSSRRDYKVGDTRGSRATSFTRVVVFIASSSR